MDLRNGFDIKRYLRTIPPYTNPATVLRLSDTRPPLPLALAVGTDPTQPCQRSIVPSALSALLHATPVCLLHGAGLAISPPFPDLPFDAFPSLLFSMDLNSQGMLFLLVLAPMFFH